MKPKRLEGAGVDSPAYKLDDGHLAKVLGLGLSRWRYLKGLMMNPIRHLQ